MSRSTKPGMVRWFSPLNAVRLGLDVAVATTVSRMIDRRSILRGLDPAWLPGARGEKADNEPGNAYQGWDQRDELWIDFVADTGDGWNSTFSVARSLAQEKLRLDDPAGCAHELPRSDILVLGGDLVYPTPREKSYEWRLLEAYQEALPEAPESQPAALAIPGNHDWYDGLSGFTEIFCASKDGFAGWRTPQTRSYWAHPLPHDWWLLGIDIQLGAELDAAQFAFFEAVGKRMTNESKVILCMPEPDWLAHRYSLRETRRGPTEQIQRALAKGSASDDETARTPGKPIDLCLAGNLHHYQRFTTEDALDEERLGHDTKGLTRIICGGGGAFLHATHAPLHRRLRNRLSVSHSFPPTSESRRYIWRLLAFPAINPGFIVFPGLLYMLAAWTPLWGLADAPAGFYPFREFTAEFLGEMVWSFPGVVGAALFAFAILNFRQFGSVLSKLLAFLHLGVQSAALIVVSYYAARIAELWDRTVGWRDFGELGLAFLGGAVVGSIVVTGYITLSALLGRFLHPAFASLRIEDWKSFLRLKVCADGSLWVHPIGIERVPRRWARRSQPGLERPPLEPEDPRATAPELIEVPFEVKPATTDRGTLEDLGKLFL